MTFSGKTAPQVFRVFQHKRPELATGLILPREPIELRIVPGDLGVVGVNVPTLDMTDRLCAVWNSLAGEHADVSGYTFKNSSLPCGVQRVAL